MQEKDLEILVQEFPDTSPDDIKGLLLAGFSVDEIRSILQASFTYTQIQTIINRIRIAQKDSHGTDVLGLTDVQIRNLVNRVATANKSPNEEIQLEGKVARLLIGYLVSFRREVINPATGKVVREIDVETLKAIIEVTVREEGKLRQVLGEKNNRLVNPQRKQVILYSSRYSRAADKQFEDSGILIIRTLRDLFDCLRSI